MIDARGLSRTFDGGKKGAVHAVRNVDLKVERGEIIALLGPNGAGKSTTLRMLTTLLAPTSGEATVAGADLLTDPLLVRSRIGFVQQAIGKTMGGTDNQCRVIDELMDQAALYRIDKDEAVERAELLAEQLDLTGLEERLVKTLSGGQRRRLEIALGLVHEPPLVFLDEPTTALDPQSRANMWDHIRALRDNLDTTIVLTTHYLDEADALCDRLFVIDNGETIAEGSPEELKQRVSSDIVTLQVPARASDHAHRILVQQPIVQQVTVGPEPGHLKLNVFHGAESLPALLRVMDAARIPLQSINLARPTLDDVFLTMTGRSLRDDSASAAKQPKPRPRLEAASADRRPSHTGPMPTTGERPVPGRQRPARPPAGGPDAARPERPSRTGPDSDGVYTGVPTRADLTADPGDYGPDPSQGTGQRPAFSPRPGGTGPRPAFSPQPGFDPAQGTGPQRGRRDPRQGRPQRPGQRDPRPQAPAAQPGFDPIPRVDPLERAARHRGDTQPPFDAPQFDPQYDPRQGTGPRRAPGPQPGFSPGGGQPGYAGPDPRQATGQRPAFDPRQGGGPQQASQQPAQPRLQPTVQRRAAATARPALPAAPVPPPPEPSPGPPPTQAQVQVPDSGGDAYPAPDPRQGTGPRQAYDPLRDSGVGGFDPLRDSGVGGIDPIRDSGAGGFDPIRDSGAGRMDPLRDSGVHPAFETRQAAPGAQPGFASSGPLPGGPQASGPMPGYAPDPAQATGQRPAYDPLQGGAPQPAPQSPLDVRSPLPPAPEPAPAPPLDAPPMPSRKPGRGVPPGGGSFPGFEPRAAGGRHSAGHDPGADSGVQPGFDSAPGYAPDTGFGAQPGYDPEQGTQLQPQPGYDPAYDPGNGSGPLPARPRRPDAGAFPDNDQWQPAGGRHASRDS